MWKRAFILMISAALLIVSGAEAASGHCTKSVMTDQPAAMSDHCADMMGMSHIPGDQGPDETESGACCCVVTSAPVLFTLPFHNAPSTDVRIWARPLDTGGQSVPTKVAIPPPRI